MSSCISVWIGDDITMLIFEGVFPSIEDGLILLSICFGFFYFFVWRVSVTQKGGLGYQESEKSLNTRFVLSSVIILAWVFSSVSLMFQTGVFQVPWLSPLTIISLILLVIASIDLIRQW